DAAHLPGADADGGEVLRVDNGVRLDVLGDAEGETQVIQFGGARRALGDDLQFHVVDHRIVARLHQQATGDRFHQQAFLARVGYAAGEQQAQVLLRGDDGDGFIAGTGRNDHFREDLGDRLRRFGI